MPMSTPWCLPSLTMPIRWVSSAAQLLDCPPYTHNKTQVSLDRPSTKTKKLETNKSTRSSVMSPPLPLTLTDTESEETSIFLLKNWDTLKTFCTCLTSSMKKISSPIQNSSEPLKYCSSYMPNTNLIAQRLPLDTCLHQVSMFTLVLLVLQEPFTVQSTEVLTKQSWECLNKSGRNRTFHNSLKTSRTERNFCTDLDTEFTNPTIQEQKSLSKLLMKYLKSPVKNSWLRLLLNCKRLLWAILTLSTENCIRTLTFTVVSFTKQWGSQLTCSQCCSWFQDAWDGWLTGANFWMTQKTRLSDQDSTTLEVTQEITFQ